MEKTQEPRLLSVLTGLRAIAAYFVCYSTMDRASLTRRGARGRVLVVAHGAHYGDPRMANAFLPATLSRHSAASSHCEKVEPL
jgi:hypothetical protein